MQFYKQIKTHNSDLESWATLFYFHILISIPDLKQMTK